MAVNYEGTIKYADSMMDPNDPLIPRINTMFLFVSTYTGFRDFTMLHRILHPHFFSDIRTSLENKFPDLLNTDGSSKLINCSTASTTNDQCAIDMHAFKAFYDFPISYQDLPRWSFAKNDNPEFKRYVHDGQLSQDLLFGNEGNPNGSTTPVSTKYTVHRTNMLSLFNAVFNYHAWQSRLVMNVGNDPNKLLSDGTAPTSPDWARRLFLELIPLTSAADSFTEFYVGAMQQYDIKYPGSDAGWHRRKNTFFLVMYPMFIFEFMCQNVGSLVPDASEKAPRNLVLRRYAVGCVYLFEYYLINLLLERDIITEPEKFKDNVNSLMRRELYNDLLTDKYSIRKDHRENNELSVQMQEINKDIVRARSNLSKAIVNNNNITLNVRLSLAYMIIWVVVFCLVSIAIPVLYFLFKKDAEGFRGQTLRYMFYLCGIMLFILALSGIIQIAKNF